MHHYKYTKNMRKIKSEDMLLHFRIENSNTS